MVFYSLDPFRNNFCCCTTTKSNIHAQEEKYHSMHQSVLKNLRCIQPNFTNSSPDWILLQVSEVKLVYMASDDVSRDQKKLKSVRTQNYLERERRRRRVVPAAPLLASCLL